MCEGGDFARYWQLDEKVGGDVKYSGSFFFFSDAQSENLLVRPRPGKGLVGFNAS